MKYVCAQLWKYLTQVHKKSHKKNFLILFGCVFI